jgi:adenylate cyclase class 2
MEDQESEVKFYVRDLAAVEKRLLQQGARLEQPRTHEINLRFDTPNGDLGREFKVVRLRRDTESRLTFKGPAHSSEGVRVRQEIEFVVGDFRAARAFLEALGLQVSMIYEKYRTTFLMKDVHVLLDELPYGSFVEIEGPEPAGILEVNRLLGLDWERRAPESYAVLFEHLRSARGYQFRDLIFENFQGIEVDWPGLGLLPADHL